MISEDTVLDFFLINMKMEKEFKECLIMNIDDVTVLDHGVETLGVHVSVTSMSGVKDIEMAFGIPYEPLLEMERVKKLNKLKELINDK